MQLSTKNIMAIFLLSVFSLTGAMSSYAAPGGTKPGSMPQKKLLPDLKPTDLFFDKKCNLKVRVKNSGQAKIDGNIEYDIYVDGDLHIGSGLAVVALFPGSNVTAEAVSDVMATWKRDEKHDFMIVLDPDNKIAEGNNVNNSFTKELLCQKYLMKHDIKKKLPETKPPVLPKKTPNKRMTIQ